MEVVYEGVLEIGKKPNSKSSRDWKPRLFVLKHYLTSGRSTLEYYKNTRKRWQKQPTKGILSLWPTFDISLAHLCSYKFTLALTTVDAGTVYLAANSAPGMNKWFYYIQTQHVMDPAPDWYVFHVQAQDSDCMNVIGVYGDCLLALTSNFELLCAQAGTKQLLAKWTFDCLKSFSHGNGLFSFVAGRHSPHGPGEYGFITGQDKTIHHTVEKLINKAKRGSMSSNASGTFSHIDRRGPLPTPDQQPPPRQDPNSPVQSSSSSSGSDVDDQLPEHLRKRAEQNVYIKNSPTPGEGDSPPQLPPRPPRGPSDTTGEPGAAWLTNRYRAAALGSPTSSEPSLPEAGSSEDHVYAHTVHRYSGATSPVAPDDPSIYNSLVRDKGGSTMPVTRVPVRGKGDYELAYPKKEDQSPVYNTAYTEDGKRASSKSPNLDIPPSEAVDAPSSQPPLSTDGNGMTANPLYGSQANLLDDIITHPLASPATRELPNIQAGISAMRASAESAPLGGSKPGDVTANPVYIESAPLASRPVQPPPSQSPPSQSPPPGYDSLSITNGAAALSTEKDGKGYTKVNKTSPPTSPRVDSITVETFETSDPPPPIPERHYDTEQ